MLTTGFFESNTLSIVDKFVLKSDGPANLILSVKSSFSSKGNYLLHCGKCFNSFN